MAIRKPKIHWSIHETIPVRRRHKLAISICDFQHARAIPHNIWKGFANEYVSNYAIDQKGSMDRKLVKKCLPRIVSFPRIWIGYPLNGYIE